MLVLDLNPNLFLQGGAALCLFKVFNRKVSRISSEALQLIGATCLEHVCTLIHYIRIGQEIKYLHTLEPRFLGKLEFTSL